MAELAEAAPQTLDTPAAGGERDAAIALVQQAAAARAQVGERPEAKPAKGKAGKAAAKAAEPAPAAEPEEVAETALEGTEGEVEAETEEAPVEEKPELPKSPPWKAYERKKAALRSERADFERAKAELNAQANDAARHGAIARQVEQLRTAGDPIALLEAFGFSYRQATEAVLKKKSPDEAMTREEYATAEKQRAERENQQSQAQQRASVEQQFLSTATNAELYPDAALFAEAFGPAEVIAGGNEAADMLRQELGRKPSFEEIADRVNTWARTYHDKVRGHAGPGTATPARSTGPVTRAKSSATRAPTTISQRAVAESSGRSKDETDAERAERARTLLAGISKRA